jgi:transposase
VRQPGPIKAWCLLAREEDHAFGQPSPTKKKLRRLEITAGAQRRADTAAGIWAANGAIRAAERELARQAELAYARTVRDWHATQSKKPGASATPGRASNRPSRGNAARQTTSP